VVRSLDQRGLVNGAAAPQVNATVPLARSSDLDRVQSAYELLDAAGFSLPVLWLVLVVATLLVATERRRAVGWLAWGSIAGLLLLSVGLLLARAAVVNELGSSDDDELVRAIWDVLVSRLYYAIGVAFLIAVAVLVVRAVLGRRRSRRYVAETHPA
jgi:cytochrome c biogenesis protein CcdA